jgi:hypothetical protein
MRITDFSPTVTSLSWRGLTARNLPPGNLLLISACLHDKLLLAVDHKAAQYPFEEGHSVA